MLEKINNRHKQHNQYGYKAWAPADNKFNLQQVNNSMIVPL